MAETFYTDAIPSIHFLTFVVSNLIWLEGEKKNGNETNKYKLYYILHSSTVVVCSSSDRDGKVGRVWEKSSSEENKLWIIQTANFGSELKKIKVWNVGDNKKGLQHVRASSGDSNYLRSRHALRCRIRCGKMTTKMVKSENEKWKLLFAQVILDSRLIGVTHLAINTLVCLLWLVFVIEHLQLTCLMTLIANAEYWVELDRWQLSIDCYQDFPVVNFLSWNWFVKKHLLELHFQL